MIQRKRRRGLRLWLLDKGLLVTGKGQDLGLSGRVRVVVARVEAASLACGGGHLFSRATMLYWLDDEGWMGVWMVMRTGLPPQKQLGAQSMS